MYNLFILMIQVAILYCMISYFMSQFIPSLSSHLVARIRKNVVYTCKKVSHYNRCMSKEAIKISLSSAVVRFKFWSDKSLENNTVLLTSIHWSIKNYYPINLIVALIFSGLMIITMMVSVSWCFHLNSETLLVIIGENPIIAR